MMKVSTRISLFALLVISTLTPSVYSGNRNVHITEMEMDASRNRHDIIPGYRRLGEQYYVAPIFGISMCSIEQNTPELLKNIFCYLSGDDNVVKSIEHPQIELHRYPCGTNAIANSSQELLEIMPRSSQMLILLKDPIQRFIQSYIDICVNLEHPCLNCKQDIPCLLKRLSEMYFNQTESTDMFIYHNFAPQTWYCGDNYALNTTVFLDYGNHGSAKEKFLSSFEVSIKNQFDEQKMEKILKNMKRSLLINDRSFEDQQIYERIYGHAVDEGSLMDRIRHIYDSDFDLLHRVFSN